MIEKLIELLDAMIDENKDKNITTEVMADYLIQNGVVILPCKVGDEVYNIESLSIIRTLKVVSIHLSDEGSIRRKKHKSHFIAIETNSKMNGKFKLDSFGITTFRTYEEAEKKLKELEHGK